MVASTLEYTEEFIQALDAYQQAKQAANGLTDRLAAARSVAKDLEQMVTTANSHLAECYRKARQLSPSFVEIA